MAVSAKGDRGAAGAGGAGSPQVKDMVFQVSLSGAASLAARGRFAEAEQALADIVKSRPDAAPAVDLLARIRAQQGRLPEAVALWRHALELDPGNEAFLAGIRRVESIQSRPWWAGAVAPLAAAAAGVLAILLAGVAVVGTINRTSEAFQRDAARVLGAAVAQQPPPASPAPGGVVVGQQVAIKIQGASVSSQRDATVVRFDAGLFAAGDRLKPEAKGILSELGVQLKPHGGRVAVQVTGCTDRKPIPGGWEFADNAALGMARAVVVFDQLRAASGLPPAAFTLRSGAEACAPRPDGPEDATPSDRTALVSITPAESRQAGP